MRPGERATLPWEVGFALHPAARGHGVMSAALRIAAQWAFAHRAPSLYWLAARGSFASWRVAHACGFTHHGTLPSGSRCVTARPTPGSPHCYPVSR